MLTLIRRWTGVSASTEAGIRRAINGDIADLRGDVQQLAAEVRENRREADRRHIDNVQRLTRVEAHLLDGGRPARR